MAAYVVFKESIVEASEDKIARARSGIAESQSFLAKEESYSPSLRQDHLIKRYKRHIEALERHIKDMEEALSNQGTQEHVFFDRAIETAVEFASNGYRMDAVNFAKAALEKLTYPDLRALMVEEIATFITAHKRGVAYSTIKDLFKQASEYERQISDEREMLWGEIITGEILSEIVNEEKKEAEKEKAAS